MSVPSLVRCFEISDVFRPGEFLVEGEFDKARGRLVFEYGIVEVQRRTISGFNVSLGEECETRLCSANWHGRRYAKEFD